MNNPMRRLRPQAIADYLWHLFEIQPGYALCVALGQPDAINNYEALLAWVRTAIERHEARADSDLIEAVKTDLLRQMQATGLVDGDVPTRAAPNALLDPTRRPLRSGRLAHNNSHEARKDGASNKPSNVFDLRGRQHRE